MKLAIAVIAAGIVLGLGAAPAAAQAKRRYVPFDVSIFPPLNIFHFERKVIVGASVNVFYGRAAAVYGVEAGLIVNREREAFGGIQVAGVANWVSGDCFAIQVASVNVCDKGHAIQAGLFNAGGDGLSAIQIGAFGNLMQSSGFALQGSLFINNTVKDMTGIQVSIVNLDGSTIPVKTGSCGYNCDVMESTVYPDARMRGIAIGVVNRAQRLRGLQLGAVMNLAEDVKGAQVGLFNMSGDVSGLQIGLVNVARRLHGLQLGALNIATKNPLPVFVGLNAGF